VLSGWYNFLLEILEYAQERLPSLNQARCRRNAPHTHAPQNAHHAPQSLTRLSIAETDRRRIDRSDLISPRRTRAHGSCGLYPQEYFFVALATAGPPTQSGHCARAPTQRCTALRSAVAQLFRLRWLAFRRSVLHSTA
jgi:hypothetical protein